MIISSPIDDDDDDDDDENNDDDYDDYQEVDVLQLKVFKGISHRLNYFFARERLPLCPDHDYCDHFDDYSAHDFFDDYNLIKIILIV